MKKGTLLLLLVILVGCGSKGKSDSNHVKLGVVGSDSVVWKYVANEAKKEGITLEIVEFSEYTQPNQALASGDIDLNAFQHTLYLDNEIETHGYDLISLAKTSIAPMGLYSKKVQSLDTITQGSKVAIPNDVTNGGRALQLLEVQGFITLNDAKFPTLKDIVSNPLNLEIIELAASIIPAALPDVDFAAINSGVAVDAGMNPKETALILEDVSISEDNPYVNLIAARREDQNNPIYLKIIEIYQTDAVRDLVIEDSKGAYIPVW